MALFPTLRVSPTLIPIGPERPLTTGSPPFAAGVLADGDVALLYAADAGVPPRALAVQRFGADGRPQGDPIDLGTVFIVTEGFDVEGLSGGGLVAVYGAAETREARNDFAVADAEGDRVGGGSITTDAVVGTGAAAAALPGGGFAVLSASRTRESDQARLNFQRFAADGDPAGAPLTVAELSGAPGSGQLVSAPEAVAANGGVRVFWNAGDDLHTALVEADGDVVGRRLLSDAASSGADAARLADGRIVATWTEGDQVAGAVIGAAGVPIEFEVGEGADASVVALESGGWAISWREDDGGSAARAWSRAGDAGPEFDVRGGFVGTTPDGEVLALRTDAGGGAWLSRYAEIPTFDLPAFDLPDLPDFGDLFGRLEREWGF